VDDFCIYLATHPGDYQYAKVACQSIRFFCGDAVPIVLIKDGEFDTSQLESLPNISSLDAHGMPDITRRFPHNMNKLKLFYDQRYPRFLYLDADIVLVSDILALPYREVDFYVPATHENLTDPQTRRNVSYVVFDLDQLRVFDPDFPQDAMISFNTGAFFGIKTPAILPDLERAVLQRLEHKELLFKRYDQGLINYVFNKAALRGDVTLGGTHFTITPPWETEAKFPNLTRESMLSRAFTERPLIHYTTPSRQLFFRQFPFAFVPMIFYRQYYDRFPPSVRLRDELNAAPKLARKAVKTYGRRARLWLRSQLKGQRR
jgi:hypothetical protein